MNTSTGALSALRRLSIVIAIAIVFVFGLATTVFLSLRSPEVQVPDVVGKDRFEAERVLGDAGLNFRVRKMRPSNQKSDTVLLQVPKGGEVVKAGQTVAMDISRPPKVGEASEAAVPEKSPEVKQSSQNTNEAALANDNKAKRNKNTNKNDNENTNTGNRNANANANVNRAAANKNANANANSSNTNKASNLNSNRPAANDNSNSNRSVNQNGQALPATAKPSPTVKPKPEDP